MLDPACYCQQESTMSGVDGCLRDQCPDQLEEARAEVVTVVRLNPCSAKVMASVDRDFM